MIDVDEFHSKFVENWSLEQIWYTPSFANYVVNLIDELEPSPDASILFLCSPTTFVAFNHQHPRESTRLLDVDKRLADLAPEQYVPYDLNEPNNFPAQLKESFDVAVVSPPYLDEVTNVKLCQTLRQVLKPRAKLFLITTYKGIIEKLYCTPPSGPMKKATLIAKYEHLKYVSVWDSWADAEYSEA